MHIKQCGQEKNFRTLLDVLVVEVERLRAFNVVANILQVLSIQNQVRLETDNVLKAKKHDEVKSTNFAKKGNLRVFHHSVGKFILFQSLL
jgi:hypothetical protein